MIQKEIAIKCLEMLDVYKPYIRKFKSKAGIPCFFENYGGFYADQEEKLWNKIKEVEAKTGCLVYAVTHELSNLGETWSMLCIAQNPECVSAYISRANSSEFYTYAYVWNESVPWFSEFGDVVVRSAYGGLKRVN